MTRIQHRRTLLAAIGTTFMVAASVVTPTAQGTGANEQPDLGLGPRAPGSGAAATGAGTRATGDAIEAVQS